MQSWGCFVIAVAGIVHAARHFPREAQESVGKALLLCFSLCNVVYGLALVTEEEETMMKEDKYK
eukprot:272096-Ditylum_brightwellii.AAC.1